MFLIIIRKIHCALGDIAKKIKKKKKKKVDKNKKKLKNNNEMK